MVAALALGAAVTAGLVAGSREAPVHVGPTAASASDQVAICFASFEIVRRVGWMRPLFGLAPAQRAVRASASSEYSAPRADPQRL